MDERGFAVDAVLFDLDGTLVDSTASVERAWARVAGDLQVPMSTFEPYVHGIPAPQVFATVLPDLPAERVAAITEQMLRQQVADVADVVAQPGARHALQAVPAARWGIVTSGDHRLASARLGAAGLPMPRVLVTTDDVAVGKPDPAGYRLGAHRLGFAAARCLVVEDAPAGVAAGRAAGMAVLGVRTTYPQLPDATATVRDLREATFAADQDGVRVTLGQAPGG